MDNENNKKTDNAVFTTYSKLHMLTAFKLAMGYLDAYIIFKKIIRFYP